MNTTVVQATAEHARLSMGTVGDDASKAALQKQIDDWNKTAARYRSEPETGEGSEQLAARAKQAEHQRDAPGGPAPLRRRDDRAEHRGDDHGADHRRAVGRGQRR